MRRCSTPTDGIWITSRRRRRALSSPRRRRWRGEWRMPTRFDAATCSAPAERAARMRDIVVAQAPRGVHLRILEIGCGTGTLALSLAEALPDASITGIDISPANIRVAVAQ